MKVKVLCGKFKYPDMTILDLSKHQAMTSVSSHYTYILLRPMVFAIRGKYIEAYFIIVIYRIARLQDIETHHASIGSIQIMVLTTSLILFLTYG